MILIDIEMFKSSSIMMEQGEVTADIHPILITYNIHIHVRVYFLYSLYVCMYVHVFDFIAYAMYNV